MSKSDSADAKLPIAEIFYSIQGEGFWTGTPMVFVRLAGCNVGRYQLHDQPLPFEPPSQALQADSLRKQYAICTTADEQFFRCDTDYHATASMTQSELIDEFRKLECERMCITGGEPFMHDGLEALIHAFLAVTQPRLCIHVETSGTKPIPSGLDMYFDDTLWITCCPKKGFLPENAYFVTEWKFLVGPEFNPQAVRDITKDSDAPVFLQPINGINSLDKSNLQRCQELILENPDWRLSTQLHKILRVR